MTMIESKTAHTAQGPHQPSLIRRIFIWHRAWVEFHKLQKLDDAALRDMGIRHSDRAAITVKDIAARIRQQGA